MKEDNCLMILERDALIDAIVETIQKGLFCNEYDFTHHFEEVLEEKNFNTSGDYIIPNHAGGTDDINRKVSLIAWDNSNEIIHSAVGIEIIYSPNSGVAKNGINICSKKYNFSDISDAMDNIVALLYCTDEANIKEGFVIYLDNDPYSFGNVIGKLRARKFITQIQADKWSQYQQCNNEYYPDKNNKFYCVILEIERDSHYFSITPTTFSCGYN